MKMTNRNILKIRENLESFRVPIFATGPEKNGFNLGYKRNFQEIFGENIFKALLPIPTTFVCRIT